MPQLFTNNARSTLQSTISDTATALTVQSGAADLFPTANTGTGSIPSTNNWFKATLQDVSGNVEIVYVRTRNAGSAVFGDLIRGQEGTTARAFVAGSVVGLRITAADVQASINIPAANNTFTGNNTFLNALGIGTSWDLLDSTGDLAAQHSGSTKIKLKDTGALEFLNGSVLDAPTGNAPSYLCRTWVNFDGFTPDPSTIRGSGNVSSITKFGTGSFGVNFTVAMPDVNFAAVSTADGTGGAAFRIVTVSQYLTTQVVIRTADVPAAASIFPTPQDTGVICLAIFR
jgi:hypothetical protein